MSKFKVLNNEGVEQFGIQVGYVGELLEEDEETLLLDFGKDSGVISDGVGTNAWWLTDEQVEEVK